VPTLPLAYQPSPWSAKCKFGLARTAGIEIGVGIVCFPCSAFRFRPAKG
jgi:hypothetical protein